MSSKQREALKEIHCQIINRLNGNLSETKMLLDVKNIINKALAEPLKNWEVGTPEEQEERFKRYCPSGDCKRYVCNSYGYEKLFRHKCALIWGQLPYESEVKR